MPTAEQQEAVKSLHSVIKFKDRAYRGLVHKAIHGKPMQQARALHKLITKHGFDEKKFKKEGILVKDCNTDWESVNAAIDVQRYYNFDLRVWPYLGIYMTQAHIDFRSYYLLKRSA